MKPNKHIYKPLVLKDTEQYLHEVFNRPAPRTILIRTGLISHFEMNWAIETHYDKSLPKYYTQIYKRIYGLVQISVGKKHYPYKIVVDLKKGVKGWYSVRIGTREICKASSITSALRELKPYIVQQIEWDKMMDENKKLHKAVWIKMNSHEQ